MNDGPVTSPGTALVAAVTENPVLVLVEPKKFDDFYDAIRREVDAHQPDTSTLKGRKAIASLAHKVTRTKTAIDDAGKKLNEDARKQIAVVDAARRDIRERLEALATEARRPLTDWEAAEEERLTECQAVIARLEAAAVIGADDTSVTVAERLAWVEAAELPTDRFQDLRPAAVAAQATAIGALQAGRDRLLQEEADRAELARLRAEAAEREEAARRAAEEQARAAEEQARAEAARVKAEAAARAEEQRQRLEEERIERERREAAEAAQREAERQARVEQERIEAAHRAEQERLRRQAEEAEQALAAERAAREREERERQAEAERVAAEERKRQEDQEHRRKTMTAAKEALMTAASITEEAARAIVLAIARDQIPHVSIKF